MLSGTCSDRIQVAIPQWSKVRIEDKTGVKRATLYETDEVEQDMNKIVISKTCLTVNLLRLEETNRKLKD